jgi:hypothetical protein
MSPPRNVPERATLRRTLADDTKGVFIGEKKKAARLWNVAA